MLAWTEANSALLDSPSLLGPRISTLTTTLKLATDEVTWWVLHADAVPEDVPRKEREADRDVSIFHPATVQALLRLSAALVGIVLDQQAKMKEVLSIKMDGCALAPPRARCGCCLLRRWLRSTPMPRVRAAHT